MKYKIVYIVSTLSRSGPTNQLLGIIKNLDKQKYQAKIITLSNEGNDSDKNLFVKCGIDIECLGLSRLCGLLFGKKILSNRLEELAPDVVHTCGIRADGFVSKINGDFFHISTIRCYPYEEYTGLYGNYLGKYFAKKHLKIIKNTQKPVGCSNAISKIFLDKHYINIDVIQDGVDSERFKPVTYDEKIKLREKLGFDTAKTLFIMSGSLIKRKNPISAIQSFCKANLINSQFVVIGDGPLMKQAKLCANDDVLFLGKVTNVEEYLCASDVVVSTSTSEGLPNSILEAVGCGLSVLLSDIPQHLEIINAGNNIGKSFSLYNQNELTNLFIKFEQEDTEQKKQQIYETFVSNFTSNIMSKRYQNIYDENIESKIDYED